MLELSPEYLLNVVDEATVIKIWKSLAGMRVYFPAKPIIYYQIRADYTKLKEDYFKRSDAVRILSSKYEISQSRIREITKECTKPLFKV
ncbi:hypothetical protein [Sulfurimonas sp.]